MLRKEKVTERKRLIIERETKRGKERERRREREYNMYVYAYIQTNQ